MRAHAAHASQAHALQAHASHAYASHPHEHSSDVHASDAHASNAKSSLCTPCMHPYAPIVGRISALLVYPHITISYTSLMQKHASTVSHGIYTTVGVYSKTALAVPHGCKYEISTIRNVG
eukprot:19934-Pleurochrysis_carterae.AAC.2